jgi:Bacterial Ig-like domain (group 2)
MPRSFLGRRFDQAIGAIGGGRGPRPRRERVSRFPGVEALESRALLANIAASGVISSAPDGNNYDYTIGLTNSSQSDSGIGTFDFASVGSQDYLATNPLSVTPPTGWTYEITSNGTGDGYSIEFTASSSAYYIQPGSSMSFLFTSADTPGSVGGNSQFYPGVPVGTSVVFPAGSLSDSGHELVVLPVAIASITVTPVAASVPSGETDQFTAIGNLTDNSTLDLTSVVSWASSATSVANIAPSGLATGVAPGPATISATFEGVTGSTALTVSPAVLEWLSVTSASPMVEIGNTDQFTATGWFSDNSTQDLTTAVNWTSGASSVASISNVSGSQGLATAAAKGSSTISAALDGITGSTTLSVTPPLESIAITPGGPSLPKGETEQFTATGTFADNSTENLTQDATWASANTATATISNATGSNGVGRALAIGTSSISATLWGVTGSTSLTVSPAVLQSIWVTSASPSILEGTSDQLTATGVYSDGSTQNLTNVVSWSSATPSVATLSSAGLADGITPGASSISASYQGLTGSTSLAVDPPPVTLTNVDPIVTRHKVKEIVLTFSSGLDPDLAFDRGLYRLVIAGSQGSFTARNAMVVKVSKVNYFAASSPDTVTIFPRAPFVLKRPVELTINGNSPSGLQDAEGRLIDGTGDGQPGGDAVAVLSKNAVNIEG